MILVSESALSTTDDPFTVEGYGFQPGEPVVLLLRIDPEWSIILDGSGASQTVADMAGAFTISIDEIGVDPGAGARVEGDRSIVAMGADGSLASTRVQIVDGQR